MRFIEICRIGKGGQGGVYQVYDTEKKSYYAKKIFAKKRNYERERDFLVQLCHLEDRRINEFIA